jgi:RNA polymerase sigma-70 factor (ECF subfamily)
MPSESSVTISRATHPPAPPDSEAWERCRGWYEAHGQAVYAYVRFHLPSADAAEDVTADTFFKAFMAADRYDQRRGDPRTWILRIAQNTLRDHFRRSRVRRYVPIGSMRDLKSESPSPEERLLWEEQVASLLAAVGELGAADRELISLRYGCGLEYSAIAEVLGVREATIRTRLWRALARLRTQLEAPPG